MDNNINKSRTNRKRRRLKKSVRHFLLGVFLIIIGSILIQTYQTKETSTVPKENNKNSKINKESIEEHSNTDVEAVVGKKDEPGKEIKTSIKISAAGDFTLGTDERFNYPDSFVKEAEANGLPYFVGGLNDIFLEDDFTTVNLETTLTTANSRANKKFTFKGDPSYAKILRLGGIEAVNLANNHIFDFLEQGYTDTIDALKNYEIGYFGYELSYLETVKGVKIAALGYEGWEDSEEIRKTIKRDIKELRKQGAQIVLIHFHWGQEKHYVPSDSQKSLARYSIDNGADLILGHHPHVVQGIEEYNGKFIVYSLGNFMFGGNRNPSDKDTFVFQQTFHLRNGQLTNEKEINIVPFSISSVSARNDYQPTFLKGTEAERVMNKIIEVSNQVNGTEWLVYTK